MQSLFGVSNVLLIITATLLADFFTLYVHIHIVVNHHDDRIASSSTLVQPSDTLTVDQKQDL